jgi:hypothetical protein
MAPKITMATANDYDSYSLLYDAYGHQPFSAEAAYTEHGVPHFRLQRLLALEMLAYAEDTSMFHVI